MAWEVGQEVFLINGSFYNTRYETAEKVLIEKVHKNGNAIVRGKQFRESGYRAGNTWSKIQIEPVTPELEAKVNAAKARSAKLALFHNLIGIAKRTLDNESVDAALAMFTEEAKQKVKE